jgi:hypothetical protein
VDFSTAYKKAPRADIGLVWRIWVDLPADPGQAPPGIDDSTSPNPPPRWPVAPPFYKRWKTPLVRCWALSIRARQPVPSRGHFGWRGRFGRQQTGRDPVPSDRLAPVARLSFDATRRIARRSPLGLRENSRRYARCPPTCLVPVCNVMLAPTKLLAGCRLKAFRRIFSRFEKLDVMFIDSSTSF